MRGLRFTSLLLLAALVCIPAFGQAIEPLSEPNFSYVQKKLEAKGVHARFIRLLAKSQVSEKTRDRIIYTNLKGFRIKPDYSGHLDSPALEKCQIFIKKHAKTFELEERLYGVPKEVVASLLWVETRHGKRTGKFKLPEVFTSIALADHPFFIQSAIDKLKLEISPQDADFPLIPEKVQAAAKRKADWAVGELVALAELHSKKGVQSFRLKGSYAGAFGIPQFLPSSYLNWAVSQKKSQRPDLFKPQDAILSVGNFLKSHGWVAEVTSHAEALYAYNRSRAYSLTILTLAGRLDPAQRSLAHSALKPSSP